MHLTWFWGIPDSKKMKYTKLWPCHLNRLAKRSLTWKFHNSRFTTNQMNPWFVNLAPRWPWHFIQNAKIPLFSKNLNIFHLLNIANAWFEFGFIKSSVFWHLFLKNTKHFNENAINFLAVTRNCFLCWKIQWVVVSYDWKIWWVVSYNSVSYRKRMRVVSNAVCSFFGRICGTPIWPLDIPTHCKEVLKKYWIRILRTDILISRTKTKGLDF